MEEGGSKAEFPLTHQLFMIGVGDLPALLNVISRSLGTLQRNNLCKCRMAFGIITACTHPYSSPASFSMHPFEKVNKTTPRCI